MLSLRFKRERNLAGCLVTALDIIYYMAPGNQVESMSDGLPAVHVVS